MMRAGRRALLVAILALACAKPVGEAAEQSPQIPAGSFQAIIGLRDPDASADEPLGPDRARVLADAVANRHGLRVDRLLTLVSAFVAIVDSSALGALREDPFVRYVEPDRLLRPFRDTS